MGTERMKINATVLEAVNYSMQQNGIPLFRSIEISSGYVNDLTGLRLEITGEPDFMEPVSVNFELASGSTLDLTEEVSVRLLPGFFASLTERVAGGVTFRVFNSTHEIVRLNKTVILLAFDEWQGSLIMPETVSAFVMPNHSYISKIISRAGRILGKWTGDSSLSAYGTNDVNRVRYAAAAIYEALTEQEIRYCVAETGYEAVGQRVRLPDAVIDTKLANCLDISLLYASCLEAAGLNPIIVLFDTHALTGVWLNNDCFTECVIDDVSYLSKNLADGVAAIAVAECTAICSDNKVNFDTAAKMAEDQIVKCRNAFHAAVDVRRSRANGIRPLPVRVLTKNGYQIVEEAEERKRPDEPRALTQKKLSKQEEDNRAAKRRNWERKLLDLGLKNLLLNMRVTLNTIPLIVTDLSAAENALAEGAEFTVLPTAQEWYKQTLDASPFELGGALPFAPALELDFKQHILRADFEGGELDKRLTNIYRASRQSIEENGANTLYLALGYLRWYENPKSVKPRYAPLVLLPLEMVRRSAKKGYAVRLRDDEAMVNITLLEMLKQDFKKDITGLDPLPKDEKNIDIKMVFTVFRNAVMDMPRWDVAECACVGIFSFNKFIMWQSLHNIDTRGNVSDVVRALETGAPLGNILKRSPEEADVEDACNSKDILLPADADASQVSAVISSDRGESFVLHGPPGTGKSQTITNIIANALYKGRRVLFVAEKMAALEVVQRRLEKLGLGAFCLELHSAKANKTAMLEQFRRAVDTAAFTSEEEFKQTGQKLQGLKNDLSVYVKKLYREYPFGMTLAGAINRYFDLEDAPDDISFSPKNFDKLTAGEISSLQNTVDELVILAKTVGHPYKHPLSFIRCSNYSVSVKTEAELAVAVLIRVVKELITLHREVDKVFEGKLPGQTAQNAENVLKISQLVQKCASLNESLLSQSDIELSLRLLKKIIESKLREIELKGKLLKKYTKGIYDIDAKGELTRYGGAENRWFLARKITQGSVRKALKKLLIKGNSLRSGEVRADLIAIDELKKHTKFLDENFSVAVIMLGNLYRHDLTDWQQITALVNDTADLYRILHIVTGNRELAMHFLRRAPEIASNGQYLRLLSLYEAKFVSFIKDRNALSQLLGIDFSAISGQGAPYFDALLGVAGGWQRRMGDLREWCAYLKQCEQAESCGIGEIPRLYREGNVSHGSIRPMFDKALAKACVMYILQEEEGLNTFSGDLFKSKIKAYGDVAAQYKQVSRELIYSKLAERLPNFNTEANSASELGVLQRAIKNGGRGITIRKLFSEMPNLIPNLAPCMLMSPISVAQYIDPAKADFDLVIFDEASQMPTYEAISPLAIAKQIIVVGDPKQLPPTSFFMNTFDDEEDFYGDDLESVLDDLLALGLSERHLLWHYRSRHESLIAFSNQHYYDGKLMTFPSPNDLISNVRFVKVNGVYERGGTKRNMGEAEAVVAEVVRRIREESGKSIGIVTFSAVQQNLIEDLLQAEFRNNPSLEQKAYAGEEPLFVKNLENVQGDERDLIIFSIGYGKDASGRLSLNFGPLNREGGYRRLNVAVSRAKYEMMIYSSIDPEDINAARTNAVGVVNLKAFLEYAKYGRSALAVNGVTSKSAFQIGGVEQSIARELTRRGYTVRTRVGASNYKVDVAVVHPNRSGEYVLGVMLDGDTYRSFKATRDRELSQYEILGGLGWNILRVWTLDYLDNKEKVVTAIVSRIEEILSGNFREIAATARRMHTSPKEAQRADRAIVLKRKPYRMADLPVNKLESAEFVSPAIQKAVAKQIANVIAVEAPISKGMLFKRVTASYGIARVTAKVTAQLDAALSALSPFTTEFNGTTFCWANRRQAETFDSYRVFGQGSEKREAKDLPYEEIAAALVEIVSNQVSLYRQDLVREIIRTLEYARGGEALTSAIGLAIDRAIGENKVTEENGRILRDARV